MLTQERLKELLWYDQKTGYFFWIKSRRQMYAGDRAGAINSDGYRRIQIDGKLYLSHRLTWLYVHGSFPKGILDHKNGIVSDCRIENMREATRSQNMANAKAKGRSGLKGAHWNEQYGKWRSAVTHNRKVIHLGTFDTPEEAHAAYCTAAKQLHGDFYSSGKMGL